LERLVLLGKVIGTGSGEIQLSEGIAGLRLFANGGK
jgi:hypothetical protein